MAVRILNVKDQAVTRGVLDKNVVHEPDLIEVTFIGDDNVPHTVYAHRSGPFQSPEDVAQAWAEGRLHEDAEHRDEPAEPLPPQGHAFE